MKIISRSGRSPNVQTYLTLLWWHTGTVPVLYRPPRYLFLINFFFVIPFYPSTCLPACLPGLLNNDHTTVQYMPAKVSLPLSSSPSPIAICLLCPSVCPPLQWKGGKKNMRRGVCKIK
ncbi:hypothetical protein B9Z19DRAFT_507831 [Tuber borchii]|uniref:Uncharacterized protein n=1 Tax=Tuber borchii TaxID=42251 RepID=A0A2T6ZE85_TUBBO|nr:hypothetical protein B9Z19DRAFT_507831 [Tuber borchii]